MLLLRALCLCIPCLLIVSGCDSSEITLGKPEIEIVTEAPASPVPQAQTSPMETGEPTYTEQISMIYEKAKAAGENVPEDVLEWAKSDMKKIGSFEYKIISIGVESDEEIVRRLDELGKERWECYFVEQTSQGKKFYFKKANRSYIQTAGKFSSFIPVPGGGTE